MSHRYRHALLVLLFVSSLMGCSSDEAPPSSTGSDDVDAAHGSDATGNGPRAASKDGDEAGTTAGRETGAAGDDGLSPDAEAGSQSADGADEPGAEQDACCAPHGAPGCADQAIMDCVCADDVLPQCCTEGWTEVCVEVVRQRYCDAGVRECVCDQWEQSGCCDTEWTQTFCDVVATTKCEATIGCGE